MVELSHWRDVVVPQRNQTGCVPTGYEWLIRYLNIENVELNGFQEEFDLDLGRMHPPYENNYESVGNRIMSRYPQITIRRQGFEQGLEKIIAIRGILESGLPCLFSLALHGMRTNDNRIIERAWHIMPIVLLDDRIMKVIHHATEQGNCIWDISVTQVIWRHNNIEGGKDISWIET